MKLTITFVVLVTYCHCIRLPESFRRCTFGQPDFKECLRTAAEYNIHQLNHPFTNLHLPGLNPLFIPVLYIGSGQSAVAVEQHFKDCKFYGFDQVELKRLEFDFEKKLLYIDAYFSEVTKKCNYQINGKVLLLPIRGEGESTVVLRSLRLSGSVEYVEVKRIGKTYFTFEEFQLSIDVTHVYFHFDNLFNGERGLGDSLNKVLNDNWKDIFDDVKPKYSKALNQILQSLFNQFFTRVPFEDIFISQ